LNIVAARSTVAPHTPTIWTTRPEQGDFQMRFTRPTRLRSAQAQRPAHRPYPPPGRRHCPRWWLL